MTERPLILFPRYEDADRANGNGGFSRFSKPSLARQIERFNPKFEQLQRTIERKNIAIQQSPSGINPECALVLETVGTVENFYTAVKKIEGLEWMFDINVEDIESDEDFYPVDRHGNAKEGNLSGKVYCVMTNKRALDELISLWRQYVNNPDMEFRRGYAGLRDIFTHLKDIRYWSPKDRLEESNVLEYWREDLELTGNQEVKFEIELFFRNSIEQRNNASNIVKKAIENMSGQILNECIIPEIAYHGLLAMLPRNQIEKILENYEDVALTKVDDIMFFRPVGQIAFPVVFEEQEILHIQEEQSNEELINSEPIVAIFDGFPMQNHVLLSNRLIIDDPDNWESEYTVRDRFHGTAMSSLVIHGDLNNDKSPLDRKVYFRPILKPFRDFNDNLRESVPDDIMIVDLIHTAVKRMFEGDGNSGPTAPTVKIINLSFGDPARQFVNVISPLARLLDWLSYKYKVLFVVSAGNHNTSGIDTGVSFLEFKRLSIEEREKLLLRKIEQNSRNTRLLSPAESINSLTVGAIFKDYAEMNENDRFIIPYRNPLPSPISAIGLGYNRSIKPDIFYNGGRKYLSEVYGSSNMRWINSYTTQPGCLVASPGTGDERTCMAYTFGTSDAAAQITHEGAKCYSVLEGIFTNQTGNKIPSEYAAVLLKSMLVHGAAWNKEAEIIADALGVSEKRVFKWLGNGVPDVTRVMECTKNRVTLIGYGSLEKDKAHVYYLPIPFDFSSGRYFRKLTVTLSYFTPIAPTRQKYRSAQVWFSIENKELTPNRVNTDDKSVKRGTVQHEIFTGDRAIAWDPNDSITIKVNCKDDAEKHFAPIDYGLIVSFEIAEEITESFDIDVYSKVLTKIRESVQIPQIRN
ncbi:S8 family peptidase [Caminicella sporogenes]|uniref:S8 family peptidase n=1 Tax=Caminicella sporogenes TaxID=166485 RepID=UPI0025409FF7|nr:S8 family peptidase [Caminicella sporogenes]WIF95100.1 S8 family peptidase [Caminicella sporogenes]